MPFPLAYFEEQEKALEFIRESPDLKIDEKKRFFKAANTNLGTHFPFTFFIILMVPVQGSPLYACQAEHRLDIVGALDSYCSFL
jgi:hypothetical protein